MLKAISLYTGIGGLDFGFEAAGFETAIAVELDKAACRTMRLNRKWPVVERDIHAVSSQEIMEVAAVDAGEADVLIGGPPCQPFSKSSYWASGDTLRLDDPRSDTLTAYLRVLRDLQPKAFLLENVHGIAFKGKDEGLQYLLKGIRQINRETGTNYSVHWQKLNAADYGVPQMRERVFLIGSRDGTPFIFPKPSHGSLDTSDLFETGSVLPHKTAWDAIGDLPQEVSDPSLKVGGKWGDLLPSIPEGENYLWHTNRGGGQPLFGWRTRYWSFMLKLAKNRPSWTIQAQPGSAVGPFHWTNRKLTAQEMCRIQTFPDGLKFESSRTDIQKMLGNAVPSLLAEVLAIEIRKQLLGQRNLRAKLKLLPPVRSPVPRPERVKPLDKKYFSYIGDYEDHPGEGKGRSAKERNANIAFA
jgi:DNA (cytosine-5)-methyltransferase 1